MKLTVLFAAVLNGVIAASAVFSERAAAEVSGGEQLMEKAGCISCHRVDQKLIGPSFKSVGAKYKADKDAPAVLFDKVREGGEGVWGDIPMQPNGPSKVSDENLKLVIDWILKL
ncbi:MAG: cyt1 [Verrucomicrobiaceae bacterium]|nr:cyt1 [Verrucomicrobiaceae bacterium]